MIPKKKQLTNLGMAFAGAVFSGAAALVGFTYAPGGLQDTHDAYDEVLAENERLRGLAASQQGLAQLALNADHLTQRVRQACQQGYVDLYADYTRRAVQHLSNMNNYDNIDLTEAVDMTNRMVATSDLLVVDRMIFGVNDVDAVYVVDPERGRILMTDNMDSAHFHAFFNVLADNDFAMPDGADSHTAFVLEEDGRMYGADLRWLPVQKDWDDLRSCRTDRLPAPTR